MIVTDDDLTYPGKNPVRPATEEATPLEETICPGCAERWEFDEPAQTGISVAMHFTYPWVVITCPGCKARFLITASGKSGKELEDEGVFVMSVSQYWIAKVKDEPKTDA